MAELPALYCETCRVPFSGPIPAQQHYSSDGHKKKEQLTDPTYLPCPIINTDIEDIPEKEYEFDGYRGFCNVCKKELSSLTVATQHLKGKNHLKAKQRWEQLKIQHHQTASIVGTLSSGGLSATVAEVKPKTKPLLQPISQLHSHEESKKCFSFQTESDSGQCFACQMKFESFGEFLQHRKTDNHKVKEREWEMNPGRRVLELDETLSINSTSSSSDDESNSTPVKMEIQSDGKKWYKCDTCNKSVNTLDQFKKHEASPKHQKRLQRRNAPIPIDPTSAEQTIWHMCDICHKKLNTEHQLHIHLKSHEPKGMEKSVQDYKNSTKLVRDGTQRHPEVYRMHQYAGSQQMNNLSKNSPGLGQGPNFFESTGKLSTDNENKEIIEMPVYDKLRPVNIEQDDKQMRPDELDGNWSRGWHSNKASDEKDSLQGMDLKGPEELAEAFLKKCHILPDTERIPDSMSANNSVSSIMSRTEIKCTSSSSPRGDCRIFQCTDHCKLCDKHCTGKVSYEQHLTSKGHLKKEKESSQDILGKDKLFPTFSDYCGLCQVPFDSERSKIAHYQGKKHLEKELKSHLVPEQVLPAIKKSIGSEVCLDYDLVESTPRAYQLELYEKAMEQDVVCFLPTGTGKTLVSIMVLSHMLRMNPYRSVVFLVDKVLLVLQQYQYIMKEIGNQEFMRCDDNNELVGRKLRIAQLCSGKMETQGQPLYRQDVVIATAAYYENLLHNSIVRWSDNCLVILDESHHCTKEHPFSRLMSKYHHALADCSMRPKVLGLTASPAGRESVSATEEMLKSLLDQLGGVKMAAVEEHKPELKRFTSNTKLLIQKVNYTHQEEIFCSLLQKYICHCYSKLQDDTNLVDLEFASHIGSSLEQRIGLDTYQSESVEILLDNINQLSAKNPNKKLLVEVLKSHVKVIANGLLTIGELGMKCAYEDMQILLDASTTGGFIHAKELGLKCEELEKLLTDFRQSKSMRIEGVGEVGAEELPVMKQLVIEILQKVDWERERGPGTSRPLVLILARRRKDVKTLTNILQNVKELIAKDIRTISIVGHAAKTSEGMTVKQQDRVMNEIRERKYQIIVATSIAEEGIDLPECELVVQMDPPNNVKSLVQIRGRARKRGSTFIALCRDQRQVNSLENLQLKEGYMMKAVDKIIMKQNGANCI